MTLLSQKRFSLTEKEKTYASNSRKEDFVANTSKIRETFKWIGALSLVPAICILVISLPPQAGNVEDKHDLTVQKIAWTCTTHVRGWVKQNDRFEEIETKMTSGDGSVSHCEHPLTSNDGSLFSPPSTYLEFSTEFKITLVSASGEVFTYTTTEAEEAEKLKTTKWCGLKHRGAPGNMLYGVRPEA